MRLSQFNVIKTDNDKTFIYNTYTQGFIAIPTCIWDNIVEDCNSIEPQLKHILSSNGIIVNNDLNEIIPYKYLFYRSAFKDRNPVIHIAPTMQCNFGCKYCFEKGNQNQGVITTTIIDNLIKFISTIANGKKFSIVWFGGEPLIGYKEIIEICDKLQEQGFDYSSSIISNGSLLTVEKLSDIEKLHLSFIQISMDGIAKDHDQRRCFKNGSPSFNLIMDNIQVLLNKTTIPVCIQVTIDKTNPHAYSDIVKYCERRFYNELMLHKLQIGFNYVRDRTGFDDSCSCFTDSDIFEYEINTLSQDPKNIKIDLPGLYKPCMYRSSNILAIDSSGNIFKCLEDMGNPNNSVGSLITGKISIQKLSACTLDNDPFEDDECLNCNVFPICGGGCPKDRQRYKTQENKGSRCSRYKTNLADMLPYLYNTKYNNAK